MVLMSTHKPFPLTTRTPPKAGLLELRADRPFFTVNLDDEHLRAPTTCPFRQILANNRPKPLFPLWLQRAATR